MTKYSVVGAGVLGLSTCYTLLENGVSGNDVTIIAKHFPGDMSAEYASPYAGATFSSLKFADEKVNEYGKFTYQNLKKLQESLGGAFECGIDMVESTEIWKYSPSIGPLGFFKSFAEGFKFLDPNELPSGAVLGSKYKTWNINTPLFLERLLKYLIERGVTIEKKSLSHISEAYQSITKVVINCTGLGALRLNGVNDTNVYPIRAQGIVIHGPHVTENYFTWGLNDATYIIKRPFSKNEVVLGGFYQPGNWSREIYGEETEDILKRTTKMFPSLLKDNLYGNKSVKDLMVMRVITALRPGRRGGPRIEKEVLPDGKVIIHNYGTAGNGYQISLGMANEAVRLALLKVAKI